LSVQDVTFTIERFAEANFERWVKDTVLDAAKAFAVAAGHSEDFIDSIKFVRTGPTKGYVVLDLVGPHNEPIGLFVEKDTKPHEIRGTDHPLGPMEGVGKSRWYWGVHHPGTTGQHIMERGAKFGMPRFHDKVISDTNSFVRGGMT
jgi:hypothetical protein